MVELAYTCPLKWPAGKKHTPQAEKGYVASAPSSLTIEEAIEYVKAELKIFPATEAVLSCDYESVANAQIRTKNGNSTGACLMVMAEGYIYHIACDKYHTIQLNIYALHLMLRHVMQMVKWGLGDIQTLLAGYRDSTTPGYSSVSGNEWWLQFLGLGPTARLSDANAVYRQRAKEAGDGADVLLRLNEAIALARQNLT